MQQQVKESVASAQLVDNDDGLGILTEQDLEYIYVINNLTDLYMMFGDGGTITERLDMLDDYIQKYGCPNGFAERLDKWDDELDKLYNEGKLDDLNV